MDTPQDPLNQPLTLGQAPVELFAPAAQALLPAGLWRRGAARTIDGIILSIVTLPLAFLQHTQELLSKLQPGANPVEFIWVALSAGGVSMLLSMVVKYMYYAWFNAKKGGTPGRLVMGLRIVNVQTGTHLSYGTTILRETIGMWVFSFGCILLLLPVWMAVARKDRRTWADLVGGSQVLFNKEV